MATGQLRHMRVWHYVEEVARAGSMRKAADRLNLTASAVQRRIHDVEQDLGMALFERTARGVRLTEAGKLFVGWIRSQSTDLDRVRSQIDDLAGLRRGNIRIACSQAVAHWFLPREIARFHAIYPFVTFEVSVHAHAVAVQAIMELDADLTLVFRPGPARELEPLFTTNQQIMAIMAADHPLANQRSVSLKDCARFPIAIFDRSFGSRQLIERLLASKSLRLPLTLESNSSELLRNFVGYGSGITFQIAIGAPDADSRSGLAIRPIRDRDLERESLVLGKLRGRALPLAVQRFAEHLIPSLKQANSRMGFVGPRRR